MRKRIIPLLAITVLTAFSGFTAETITFGRTDMWSGLLAMERLVVESGRQGYDDIRLMYGARTNDSDTELHLGFDRLPILDDAGQYGIVAPSAELSPGTRRSGLQGLLLDGPEDQIKLTPGPGALFTPGTEWGSFSIAFWYYPATVDEGDTLLSWSAVEGSLFDFREQTIQVAVRDGRLEFVFENFFVPSDGRDHTVSLFARRPIIPRSWSHHLVRFSDENGLLEYLVDGLPVAVTHVSDSGGEDGTVHFPRIAAFVRDGLCIGGNLVGALDEFRITRRFEHDPDLGLYPRTGGRFVTQVIDLGSPGAMVDTITAVTDTPGNSDVFVYYRVGNTQFVDPTDTKASNWVAFEPGRSLGAPQGRFVQLMAELYPDPAAEVSPRLSELALRYVPNPPLYPPSSVMAQPLDGAVRLEWAPVNDPDIEGYLVYYGEQSGRYFGTESSLGPSPIRVDSATSLLVDGLRNGALYYFSVASIDRHSDGPGSARELSREVVARPARVYQ